MRDLKLASSIEDALRVLNDKIENLARKPGIPRTGGFTSVTAAYTHTPANTEVMSPETVSFDAVSGRRYEFVLVRNESSVGSPIFTVNFRVASGPVLTITDTLVRPFTVVPSGANETQTRMCWWTATFTGPATAGVSAYRNATGTSVSVDGGRPRDFIVKDVT